jgi:RHS repeat-associated protein
LEERDLYFYHPDHLGSTSIITDRNGIATQFVAYMPFGESFVDEHTSSWESPYKFSGKEIDEETGLYYYGARYYDPKTSIWYGVDPLVEKYSNVGGYAYCNNNPINFIDPDGLYPRPILIYDAKLGLYGGYKFTQSAAHLLSLVSGVSRVYIDNVVVQERAAGQYRPWYSAKDGGGAITLGSGVLNSNITYTENFFNDDPSSYNGHGYGQDVMAWLSLSSHEVGHLPQIGKAGGFFSYVLGFAIEYAKSGHDAAPSEIEADKGYTVFNAFNKFVNKTYGNGSMEKLFNSDMREGKKVETITSWWNAYQDTQNKQTNSFFNNFQNLQEGTYKWNGSSWERQ